MSMNINPGSTSTSGDSKGEARDVIARKLDFDLTSFGDRSHKENVRISNDLIKNENMFISHVFKTEYIKFEKITKTNFVETDHEILKVFSQITKLIKINNMYNINSITDFYILQLMILENDFKICYQQRDKFYSELKHKSEKLNSQEDELRFLKERIRSYEMQAENEKQMEIFQKEIQTIREKLVQKSNEMLRFENYHREALERSKNKVKEVAELHQQSLEENQRLKNILSDLISAYKKGSDPEVKAILTYLIDNESEFEDIKTGSLNSPEPKNIESSHQLDEKNLKTENENLEDDFAQKVISEFDKVLNEEFKRVQRFFKKDGTDFKRKSTMNTTVNEGRKRSMTGGKNYIEWKARTSNMNWLDSLRNKKEKEETKKVDIHDLAQSSKNKIRSSICNIDRLVTNSNTPINKPPLDETFFKNETSENLSKFYEDKFGKSHSPVHKDTQSKKIGKKDESMREKFEGNLRKALFKYKQK